MRATGTAEQHLFLVRGCSRSLAAVHLVYYELQGDIFGCMYSGEEAFCGMTLSRLLQAFPNVRLRALEGLAVHLMFGLDCLSSLLPTGRQQICWCCLILLCSGSRGILLCC